MTGPSEPEYLDRFLCDHMLGTLARWLRLLGFDTAYPGPLGDRELIGLAREEGRVLLTRDKNLAQTKDVKALYVGSDVLDEQVGQALQALHLVVRNPMSRCSICNGVLLPASPEEASGNVPPGVLRRHEEFWRCPVCGRFYWQGSHWDQMRRKIEDYTALSERPSEGGPPGHPSRQGK